MTKHMAAAAATVAAVALAGAAAGQSTPGDRHLPQGSEPVDAEPGRLHDDHRQPVLADAARQRWVYRETTRGASGEGHGHRDPPHEADRQRRNGARRARRRTDGAGPSRSPTTGTPRTWPATSGTSARPPPSTATARSSRALARSRPASTAPRPGSRCRPTPARPVLPPGVLRGRGRGHGRDRHRRQGARRGPVRLLQTRRPDDARPRPDRAARAGAEVLRPRRRPGPQRPHRRRRRPRGADLLAQIARSRRRPARRPPSALLVSMGTAEVLNSVP